MTDTLIASIKVVATLEKRLAKFKADKKAADDAIAVIVAETQVGKDLARAKEMIQATTEAIEDQKAQVEGMAIEAFSNTDEGKQLSLAGGAVVVRYQSWAIISDTDRALNYVRETAPAMVKLVPVNKRSYEAHLRKVAETLDPEGVREFVQVIYEPKVFYFKKPLAALIVPVVDEGEDNRIPF